MQVIFEDASALVDEAGKLRNRVPMGAIQALGAQSNQDAINWQVQDFGAQGKLLVGTLAINGRADIVRKPPAQASAAAGAAKGGKKSEAKSAKKGAAKKSAVVAPAGIGSVFADDDEYLDDSPVAPAATTKQPAKSTRPATPAQLAARQRFADAARARAAAKNAGQKGGAVPTPKAGAVKGGAAKKGATKKGAVAYQVPGGVGAQFAE